MFFTSRYWANENLNLGLIGSNRQPCATKLLALSTKTISLQVNPHVLMEGW